MQAVVNFFILFTVASTEVAKRHRVVAAAASADAGIITGSLSSSATVQGKGPFTQLATAQQNFSIDGVQETLTLRHGPTSGNGRGIEADLNGGLRIFTDSGNSSERRPALNFANGVPVGGPYLAKSAIVFNKLSVLRSTNTVSGRRSYGAFATGKTGFAGFELPDSLGGGKGWLRLELVDLNNDGYADQARAIDYAYNDAGGTITAGDTGASVPEPSALGCWPWAARVCWRGVGGVRLRLRRFKRQDLVNGRGFIWDFGIAAGDGHVEVNDYLRRSARTNEMIDCYCNDQRSIHPDIGRVCGWLGA